MTHEGLEDVGAALNGTRVGTGRVGEFVDVGDREVRHGVPLEVSPKVFDRVEFRRVGGQELAAQEWARVEELAHDNGVVRPQVVPHHDERRVELAFQLREEVPGAARVDVGVPVQAEVQAHLVPPRGHAQGGDGAHLPVRAGALPDDGRRAARCPAAPNQRRHQERGLVYEHQPGLQARGVFFTRAQSRPIQVATAFPSRSRARRAGFCGLQPSERIRRPMWSTW